MFAIRFMKATPTTHVLHFTNGRVRREGPGLSFFYYAPTSTIVSVPLESADVPFAFQESTADFQSVSIQGQLTYRVSDPKRLSSLLDFSIGPLGTFRSEDYRKLPERLVHTTQTLMRAETQKFSLRDALTSSGPLSVSVLAGLKSSESVAQLGVEILNLSLLYIRPTPEMAMEKRIENDRKEADSRAYGLDAMLKPVRNVDWRTLMTISQHGVDPKTMIALAFQEMASNAQKIGELNISPDLLRSLVASAATTPAVPAQQKGK